MIRYIPVSLSLVAAAVSGVLYAAPINTPVLATMDNFRDIAGTTSVYTTSHDGTLRTGVFYRSNALALSSADQATLSTLGISDVYDLRTASEIASSPDVMPDGARYTHIDIIGNTASGSNITSITFSSAAEAKAMMQQPTSPSSAMPGCAPGSPRYLTIWPAPTAQRCSIVPRARTAPAGPPRCC